MEQERRPTYRVALVAGDILLRVARRAFRALPARARADLESRFFGSVFQVTRVTNDAYGWRPDAPPRGEPQRGEPPKAKEP